MSLWIFNGVKKRGGEGEGHDTRARRDIVFAEVTSRLHTFTFNLEQNFVV